MRALYIEGGGAREFIFSPELLSVFPTGDWAPIEHKIVGSSPSTADGRWMDVAPLISSAMQGDRDAIRTLLTPVDLRDRIKDSSSIQRERLLEREKKTRVGYLVVFDHEQQCDLSRQGIVFFLVPSDLDQATGLIKPSWEVALLRRDGQEIPTSIAQELNLDPHFKESFRLLQSHDNQSGRVLAFNIPLHTIALRH